VPQPTSMPWAIIDSAKASVNALKGKDGTSSLLIPFPEIVQVDGEERFSDERRNIAARAVAALRDARSEPVMINAARRSSLLAAESAGVADDVVPELSSEARAALNGKLFDLHAGVAARSEGMLLTQEQRKALLTSVSDLPPPSPGNARRHSTEDVAVPSLTRSTAVNKRLSLPELPALDDQLGIKKSEPAVETSGVSFEATDIESSADFLALRAAGERNEARSTVAAVEDAPESSEAFIAKRNKLEAGESGNLQMQPRRPIAFGKRT